MTPAQQQALSDLVNVFGEITKQLSEALKPLANLAPPGGKTEKADGVFTIIAEIAVALLAAVSVFKAVSAFSPQSMVLFNQALQNVWATIGQALLPAIQVLIQVLDQLSGVLGPLMRQLAPVFQQLAEALTSALIPIFKAFAEIIRSLLPVINVLIEFIQMVSDVLTVFAAAVEALFAVLRPVFGAAAAVFRGLEDVIKLVIRSLFQMAATLIKFFGGDALLAKMIESLTKQAAGKDLNLAAQSPAIKSFKQIQDDFAQAAFVATGAGEKQRDTSDFLKEIIADLKDIKQNGIAVKNLNPVQAAVQATAPDAPTIEIDPWNPVGTGVLWTAQMAGRGAAIVKSWFE